MLSNLILQVILVFACIQFLGAYRMHLGQSLTMKGRKVPLPYKEIANQQKMMKKAKEDLQKTKEKGMPIFNIFVRGKNGGPWIPAGNMVGDARSTAVINAWLSGFLADFYKKQLDRGIASSLFTANDEFAESVIKNMQVFRKFSKEDLQFGYEIDFPGVEEKYGSFVTTVTKDMKKSWFDNIKESITMLFQEQKSNRES